MNKINKLGFVLPNLGSNQASFEIVSSTNRYLADHDETDITLFFRNVSPFFIKPNTACMCLFEAFNFCGHLFATDISSASRILSYPGPNRFSINWYCYDLDYLRQTNKQYEQLAEIYLHPRLNLIARSKAHFEILSSTWKTPVATIEGADISKFIKLIHGNPPSTAI